MNIVQLTEGAGRRYTSTGIRDQALVNALRRIGHRVTYIRIWDDLPQEDEEVWDHGIFFDKQWYALHRYSTLSNILPDIVTKRIVDYLARQGTKKIDRLTPAQKIKLNCDCLELQHPFFQKQYRELVEQLKRGKPDIINVSSLRFASLIPLLKTDLDCPVVATLTGSLCNWMRTGILDNKKLSGRLNTTLSAADAILSPSQYIADESIKFLHLEKSRITVIPTGFMLNFYSARELIPATPTLCFIGQPSTANGITQLIDALKILDQRGVQHKLLAAGNMTAKDVQKFRKYLKPIFSKRPDDLQVFPTVSILDKTHILEQSTVVTLPGFQKTFGNPAVEAMAAAVPLVVPNAGPFPEIMNGSEVGLMFDPTSTESYADALERLLTDREYNKACGHRARAEAINRFPSERMAGEIMELFKTLV